MPGGARNAAVRKLAQEREAQAAKETGRGRPVVVRLEREWTPPWYVRMLGRWKPW